MVAATAHRITQDERRAPRPRYQPGDLVTPMRGYPILYEVLIIEHEGTLRVRGMNWAPGYSALVDTGAVRPVNRILLD